MAKKNKTTITMLKYYALKLRANRQLPFYLCYLIQRLDGTEEVNYISFLKQLSEHLLRIKNYYKRYPQAEDEAEKSIKEGLTKLGYQVIDINA